MILIVRAFAFGSVALSGTEAITNGVPAFKPPEASNAANTMLAMGLLLGRSSLGSVLAYGFGIVPDPAEEGTLVAMVAPQVFGDGPAFLLFQAVTALILFLAANTGFNGVPAWPGSWRWTSTCPASSGSWRPPRVQLGDRRPRGLRGADLALRRWSPR